MKEAAARPLPGALARAALSMVDNMLVVTEVDGTIVYVNEAFTRITGYPEEEALGGTPALLRSGAQDEAFYESLWACVLSGQRWDGEIVNRRKDGSLYTDRMTITPLLDSDGVIRHFVAVKRDVSSHVAALTAGSPTGLAHLDATGRLVYGNTRLETLLKRSYEQLLGHAWLDAVTPASAAELRDLVGATDKHTERSVVISTMAGLDVRVQLASLDLGDGAPAGIVATFEDVTAQLAAEHELERREAFVRTVLDSIETPTVVVDAAGAIRSVNASWTERCSDGSIEDVLGTSYVALCEAGDAPVVPEAETARTALAAVLDGGRVTHTPEYPADDGTWWELRVTPLRIDDGGAVLVHTDVTAHHHLAEVLRTRATTDPLTGLPNRAGLEEHAPHALARAKRTGVPLTVLFVDLDSFKPINDTYGHDAGDLVLQACAVRLRQAVRGGDVPARVGGDEFVILCEGVAEGRSRTIIERIESAMTGPIELPDGTAVRVGASIGAARATDGSTLDDLIRTADEAMYAVKHARHTPPRTR